MGESDTSMSEFFPSFYWILRDFSLNLKGKTPNEYLESVLSPVPGTGQDIEVKLNNHFIAKKYDSRKTQKLFHKSKLRMFCTTIRE